MEKLKFMKVGSLLLFMAIISMVVISGCKKDPVVVPTDFTALNAKITEAETLISSTEEGTAEGQYPRGSQDVLQTSIDAAKVVADNTASDQKSVDNTVISLQEKMDVYTGGVIEAIDPTNLVGHWTFTEGAGTTVADYSGNDFDGTFETGHTAFGAGTASWGTDRYGNANSALVVDKGAWVKVPYNAALNPTDITISLWINANVLGGRFMGLQSWIGYKFEVPDHGKPFFTAGTVDGPWDIDTGISIVAGEWYHLAVSYSAGEIVFYIDGTEVKRETNVDRAGGLKTIGGHDLAIGVDSSKYADTDSGWPDDDTIPAPWGGFFNGSMDELRIYKTALSPTQIQSIYDLEKP